MVRSKIHPDLAFRPGLGSDSVGFDASACMARLRACQSLQNHHRQIAYTKARTASATGNAQRKKSSTVRWALSAMVMPTGPNALAAEPVLVAKTSMMRNGIGRTR